VEYLINKNELKEIVEKFGLETKTIFYFGTYCIIRTDRGLYSLKPVNDDKLDLLFLHGAKEHLAERGFLFTDRYVTAGGKPYVELNKKLYVMARWIKGKRCNPYSFYDIEMAAKTLAYFHKSSKGYKPSEGSTWRSNLGKWPEILLKRCEDFTYMKSLAKMKSVKKPTDILFLQNIDTIYYMAIEAVKTLQRNGYFKQVEEEEKKCYLCHGNYNYLNIIVDDRDKYNIINFDYCRYELRCLDIVNLIMDFSYRTWWNFDIALKIIEAYNCIRTIQEQEYKVMDSLFKFPHRIWKISSEYYCGSYSLNEKIYYKGLRHAVENINSQIRFLDRYCREFM
jgi:spore coat protein I